MNANHDLVVQVQDASLRLPYIDRNTYNLKRLIARLITGRRSEVRWVSALTNVNLSVAAGSRIGLIGPNGAGKTSLLKVISGSLLPTSGSVMRRGRVVSLIGDPSFGLDLELTGAMNVENMVFLQGVKKSRIQRQTREILEISGLGDAVSRPCYTYSAGMLTRLKVSLLLFRDADIWVVDEGISTADDEFNREVHSRLLSRIAGTTLILATHNERLLRSLCSTAVVMANGTVLHEGGIEDAIHFRTSLTSHLERTSVTTMDGTS